MVSRSRQVFLPCSAHRFRVEESFVAHSRRREQLLGPLSQRAEQPLPHRYAEARLGPFDGLLRNVAVEDAAQDTLSLLP